MDKLSKAAAPTLFAIAIVLGGGNITAAGAATTITREA